MSTNQSVSDELLDRLAKTVLGVFTADTVRTPKSPEEIIISDDDDATDAKGNKKPNSESCVVISSDEDVQNKEKNACPRDLKRTNKVDESTKDDSYSESDSLPNSHCEDDKDNDSDVIDLSVNDEDLFKKLDKQPMICYRCFPIKHFRKKSLYIIHRTRHFSENHFICPICRQGFVKLTHCIHHELKVHKEETQLTDQGFTSALLDMQLADTAALSCNGSNNSNKPENDVIYSDHAVVSSSLYPYSGPPVGSCADTYNIQYKYGRPQISTINNLTKSVMNWRNQEAIYAAQGAEFVATDAAVQDAPTVTVEYKNISEASSDKSDKCNAKNSDSSFGSQIKRKKRKKYRKKTKKVKSGNVNSYWCTATACGFSCNLESEFKSHCQTDHPNLTEEQVLQHFVLPSMGSYLPVSKKKTGIGPPPTKRKRLELSDDSSPEGSSIADACSFASSHSEYNTKPQPAPDYSTQEGFCSSLGLIRNNSLL